MSVRWINAALAEKHTKNCARLLLFVLADRADDNGGSYYSIETLTRMANVGRSTTHGAIGELVKLGVLRVDYKKGPKGCNIYTLQNLDRPESGPSKIETGTLQNLDKDPPESGPNPSGTVIEPSNTLTRAHGTLGECRAFAEERHLPASDGEAFFDKLTGSGWRNAGQPVRDWRATFRNWQAQGYHPSQKINGATRNGRAAPRGKPIQDRTYTETQL
jgi:hypothetical protein